MRAGDVEDALLREVARIVGEPSDDLDPACSLSELGVDSVGYCTVSAFVEKRFGIAVAPEALFEFSSVRATATHVAETIAGHGPATPPAAPGAIAVITPPDAGYSARDVAIVGLALKVPGADDPHQYLESDPRRRLADSGVSPQPRARGCSGEPGLPQGWVR